MNNRNTIRKIILEAGNLPVGEMISIENLSLKFPDLKQDDLIKIIIELAVRYYVKIDGKYPHECQILEKYNKISGLERDGYDAIDAIKTDKIWQKVENALIDYPDFSVFMAVALAKKIIEKELEKLSKEA